MMASNRKVTGVAKKVKETGNTKTSAWSIDSDAVLVHNFVPHALSAIEASLDGKYVYGGSDKVTSLSVLLIAEFVQGTLLVWHAPSGRLIVSLPDLCQNITVMKVWDHFRLLALP